jgi:nifR3 family TIM-barrel protein
MDGVDLRLGPLALDPPVVLAPMAGVTDAPFRVLCAEQGGALFVSEMLTARGLVEGGAKSWAMSTHHPDERVRSVQLYGADPRAMGEAVRRLVDTQRIDHIDLNFGCPVPKVTRNGGGAALPVRRALLAAIVAAAVEAAGPVPVTMKMRMGLDAERLTYRDAAAMAADCGIAAVALHARTARQGYAGQADWSAIGLLRAELPAAVPVLGNGDIWAASDAVEMMRSTGCDGVVIGRGCLGRPWLFADLARVFAGAEPLGPPRLGAIATTIGRHLELALDWYEDETTAVRRLRKHLRWYLQGYPVGAEARRAAGTVSSAADVAALVDQLDPELEVLPHEVRAPRGRTDAMARLVLPEGWCDAPDAMTPVADPLVAHSGG